MVSESCLRQKPVKPTIKPADKNYWKCNLAFICASYYREGGTSAIQFLYGIHTQ